MFLTLRVFGHVLETIKGIGDIQIALFHIFGDVVTIFWQITATILAFSIAITKVFMAERSFISKNNDTESWVQHTFNIKHPPARHSIAPVKMQAKFFWFAESSYLINIFGWEMKKGLAKEFLFPSFVCYFVAKCTLFFPSITLSVRRFFSHSGKRVFRLWLNYTLDTLWKSIFKIELSAISAIVEGLFPLLIELEELSFLEILILCRNQL